MSISDALQVLEAAGFDIHENPPSPAVLRRAQELMGRSRNNAASLVIDVVRAERTADEAKRNCAVAAEAAEQLQELLRTMVEGHAALHHLKTVRHTLDGPRAICLSGNNLQELAIHPDVNVEELEELESWEYVCIHENVVVGTWRDDDALFADAYGEIVSFKNHVDRDTFQVEVSRAGHDNHVATLAESLRDEVLTPHSRLVLQRDDPHRVIALADAEQVQSKFEVPIDQIDICLEDLAGIDEIAERLIEDIVLRICHSDVRDQFNLQAMRGILLYSYKPGMGKSKFISAIARWLYEHRDVLGYEVVLYQLKPNESKNMWHGEDSRIIREELFGRIRARQAQPRTRPLIQLVVFDELDSLGRRGGGGEQVTSAAQSDALEAILVEMDGLAWSAASDVPPAHVLCCGMTNRPDRVDDAAKRPGRFGDLVMAMPDVTVESAENVMAIYARGAAMPWYFDGAIHTGVAAELIRARMLRPALVQVFGAVVVRYKTDTQRSIDVTAGEIMANVHFMDAFNSAKRRAAVRYLRKSGAAGIGYDDVVDCLLDSALSVAQQMEADPQMLIRHLQVKVPVTRVDAVAKEELAEHRYLRVHSA